MLQFKTNDSHYNPTLMALQIFWLKEQMQQFIKN